MRVWTSKCHPGTTSYLLPLLLRGLALSLSIGLITLELASRHLLDKHLVQLLVGATGGLREVEPQEDQAQDGQAAEDEAESPAVSSPLLPVLPRFLNGNSLSVLTKWLDLEFARLGMTQRLHSNYKTIRA